MGRDAPLHPTPAILSKAHVSAGLRGCDTWVGALPVAGAVVRNMTEFTPTGAEAFECPGNHVW
jgi:hypothetical protein